jgi:hypothetical protein
MASNGFYGALLGRAGKGRIAIGQGARARAGQGQGSRASAKGKGRAYAAGTKKGPQKRPLVSIVCCD